MDVLEICECANAINQPSLEYKLKQLRPVILKYKFNHLLTHIIENSNH